MKTFKILAFMAIVMVAFTFSSCETDVVDPAGERGAGIIPSIENLDPAVFDVMDPENTFIQFDVNAEGVDEVKIVVSFNGNKKRVEIDKLTTFPKNIKIFMRDAAEKLGVALADVSAGDAFNFELVTVQGSNSYRSSASFNAAVVCAYDVNMVTGTYNAVSDDWGVDGTVTITADPADEYKLYVAGLIELDGLPEDKGPLVMIVNPKNFAIDAPRTVLASDFFGYTNVAYEGFGELNTCTGKYQMNFTITVDQGSFGQFPFTFTKQ